MFKIRGKVIEKLEVKELSEKTNKQVILVEYRCSKNSLKKVLLSLFINKEQENKKTDIELIENKIYLFSVNINAKESKSGKWINNIDIFKIEEDTKEADL